MLARLCLSTKVCVGRVWRLCSSTTDAHPYIYIYIYGSRVPNNKMSIPSISVSLSREKGRECRPTMHTRLSSHLRTQNTLRTDKASRDFQWCITHLRCGFGNSVLCPIASCLVLLCSCRRWARRPRPHHSSCGRDHRRGYLK